MSPLRTGSGGAGKGEIRNQKGERRLAKLDELANKG